MTHISRGVGVLHPWKTLPFRPSRCAAWPPSWKTPADLSEAADMYRAAMAAAGPDPEVCFQLAELLYRLGDLRAARERYYMAIELDEDYVEARANLGCVLAEMGQRELALAAFEGASRYHPDYADAHYHLARTLDELGIAADRPRSIGGSSSPWPRTVLGPQRPPSG